METWRTAFFLVKSYLTLFDFFKMSYSRHICWHPRKSKLEEKKHSPKRKRNFLIVLEVHLTQNPLGVTVCSVTIGSVATSFLGRRRMSLCVASVTISSSFWFSNYASQILQLGALWLGIDSLGRPGWHKQVNLLFSGGKILRFYWRFSCTVWVRKAEEVLKR